jgi:anti-sigma-K factor RskA
MTDELKFPDPLERRAPRDADALDERTARAIHDVYLPPVARGGAENAYWSALEQRIMSRVAGADPVRREQGYWSVLNGWSQVGLVAAAALLAIGGLVSQQLGEPEEQVAYESVMPASTPDAISAPAALLTASNTSAQRDAALQYVLSY